MSPAGLLIPRIGNEHAVAECWERFVHNDPLPANPVRGVVLESWLRCRSEAVDPGRPCAPAAADDQVRALREEHRQLYDAARPVLNQLREVLRESGTLILLTDPSGTIIDLHGDTRARHAGEGVNLAQGGRWQEEVIGTNAIGTAIAAGAPVQIYASEHYCLDVKQWTCAAAPIYDPSGSVLLGVVDVSGVKETFHGHSLGLVIAAAKQIESVIARHELDRYTRLLDHSLDGFARYAGDCLVLFDRRGRVVRGNGRLQLARELYGVHLPLEAGGQVDALNLGLPPAERLLRAPPWLRPEWLHPVRSRDAELGTLLVIPLRQASAPTGKRESAAVAPPSLTAPRDPTPLPRSGDPFAEVIGDSACITSAIARARRLGPLDLPVLLLGETGAGKELFARGIHRSGNRPEAPFVALNCGALTRELLASELFGYVEGAFTGARRGGLPGKFELADGGTLFLDEIGEMPLEMQPHLLRVLQDGIVVRLGDTKERRVNVRLIAATNRDLREEVATGRFREDLFHRLCVTSIRLPALRERAADIDAIVDHLNTRLAIKYGCPRKTITAAARAALRHYAWPGNVRELLNVFEASFALSEDVLIDLAVLPDEVKRVATTPASLGADPAPTQAAGAPAATGCDRLEDVERQTILAAVSNAHGNLSQAARTLGISRSTLYVKLAALREPAGSRAMKH